MFGKSIAIVLALGVMATALLAFRQQRFELASRISRTHWRLLEQERSLGRSRAGGRCREARRHPHGDRRDEGELEAHSAPSGCTESADAAAVGDPTGTRGGARAAPRGVWWMTMQSTTPLSEAQSSRVRAWSRFLVIASVTLLLGTVARIVWLKVVPDERLMAAAGSHRSDAREPAERGQIVDRRGRVLATSLMARRVYVDPAFLYDRGWERVRKANKTDPTSAATADPFRDVSIALSSILDEPVSKLETMLKNRSDDRYLVLADGLTNEQVDEIRRLHMPGVGVESYPERKYPAGSIASQVVGRVGAESAGQSGAELQHERAMQGPMATWASCATCSDGRCGSTTRTTSHRRTARMFA